MSLRTKFAVVGALLSWVCSAHGQSPFFCQDYPNNGFDCVPHDTIEGAPLACPDPLLEPWCACLKTYFSDETPGVKPSITQEVVYPEDQPTAGTYFVDVSRGTLDLSTVSVGDVVFNFIICVDGSVINVMEPSCAPGCPPFDLNFEGIVTDKTENSLAVELTLPPDTNQNPINVGILTYDPVDADHSFGKTYQGALTSRGPGKGFTFEYQMYEPVPPAISRGLEDGDLDGPGFTAEALMIVADGQVGIYSSPPCGKVAVDTTITPKVPIGEVTEKFFESEFEFGGENYTVGISGNTTANVGDSVLLTATSTALEPPAYSWTVVSGEGNLTDNKDGTATVTSSAAGSVTVRLIGTACSTSKTSDITIQFAGTGGRQRPGDCNQDGKLDISDAICLLGHLFLGNPTQVPCGDKTVNDPANVQLLSSNGDPKVDISDPVYVLTFLFLGGPEPALGKGCVVIAGCPSNDKCQ